MDGFGLYGLLCCCCCCCLAFFCFEPGCWFCFGWDDAIPDCLEFFLLPLLLLLLPLVVLLLLYGCPFVGFSVFFDPKDCCFPEASSRCLDGLDDDDDVEDSAASSGPTTGLVDATRTHALSGKDCVVVVVVVKGTNKEEEEDGSGSSCSDLTATVSCWTAVCSIDSVLTLLLSFSSTFIAGRFLAGGSGTGSDGGRFSTAA